jgi:hypothetical protein
MERVGREEWTKRVQRWHSGLTAREFALETGVTESSLSFWNWRLKKDAEAERAPKPTKPTKPTKRPAERQPHRGSGADPGVRRDQAAPATKANGPRSDSGSCSARRHRGHSRRSAARNAVFTTLLASCRMLRVEPWSYLRDILCLLPRWPSHRILELVVHDDNPHTRGSGSGRARRATGYLRLHRRNA